MQAYRPFCFIHKIMELAQKKSKATAIANSIFLIVLNLVLMSGFAYLTMDSEANMNSRIAACLLSFFVPIFIVFKTQNMNGIERMLKYGGGLIAHIIMAWIIVGFPTAFVSGLIPCLTISLAILFYGKELAA